MKKKNNKPNSKNNSRSNSKNKKNQPSRFKKVLNKLMPYILTVSFVVILFSLVGFLGGFGTGVKNVLGGLFSNFASYFIPLFMIYHAIMWYYDTKRKICTRRVICSFTAVILLSSLQHVITKKTNPAIDASRSLKALYSYGVQGQGGGAIGGKIANMLLSMGTFIAITIIFVLLAFMFLQMFNITPASMIRSAANSKKENDSDTEKPNKPKKKGKIKHKNVDIFDDDDDLDEDNISSIELTGTVVIPTTENQNEPETNFKRADEVMHGASALESSGQLKPYDESKNYSKPSEPQKNDELVVTSSKLGEEEPYMELNRPSLPPSPQIVQTTPAQTEQSAPNTQPQQAVQNVQPQQTVQATQPQQTEQTVQPQQNVQATQPQQTVQTIQPQQTVQSPQSPQAGMPANVQEPSVAANMTETQKSGAQVSSAKTEDENEPSSNTPAPTFNNNMKSEANGKKSQANEDSAPTIVEDALENHLSEAVRNMLMPKPKEELPVERREITPQKPTKNEETNPMSEAKKTAKTKYIFPSLELLKSEEKQENEEAVLEELHENADKIVKTLNEFNVKTRIEDIVRGPTVTRYELVPEAGVRVKAIANLADDIALKLAADEVRIECPIPGKSAVGIEVPNKITSMVYLKELLTTDKFKKAKGVLTCAIGKSVSGEEIFVDIEKTPHLLVAGATGMGKSVCINSFLISMLYKASPEDLRLILIDPKRVELTNYNGIPHLLVPVVTEPKKSLGALQWAVTEMDRRFEIIEQAGVRNLAEFNEMVENGYEAEKLSRIVIVIDELADLKMTVPDIEGHITRLTQKARAAGIHIIIGTQRPSVDVITGLIKNNIPSRIAFKVPSLTDSRTILDEQGAEKLVSRGDMLIKIVGNLKPIRVQGAFVSAGEIKLVIDFLKENSTANYDEEVMQQIDSNAAKLAKAEKRESGDEDGDDDERDPEFYAALKIAAEDGKISSSLLQRKLKLGFQRAARILDQMEECGFIGEANGSKPRDVLITIDEYREIMMRTEDEEG